MTVTVRKKIYEKVKPKIVNYRDYKSFYHDTYPQILLEKLSTENIISNCIHFEKFVLIFVFAPCKKKYSPGNNMPFITISLKKPQMKERRLKNIYMKSKADANRNAYIKQRNYYVSHLQKTKK